MASNKNVLEITELISPQSTSNANLTNQITVPVIKPPEETYGYLPDSYKDRWLHGLDNIKIDSPRMRHCTPIISLIITTFFGIALSKLFDENISLGWVIATIISIIIYAVLYVITTKNYEKEAFIIEDIKREINKIPTNLGDLKNDG